MRISRGKWDSSNSVSKKDRIPTKIIFQNKCVCWIRFTFRHFHTFHTKESWRCRRKNSKWVMSCVNCLVHIIHQWEELKKLLVPLLTAKIEHTEVFLYRICREKEKRYICANLRSFAIVSILTLKLPRPFPCWRYNSIAFKKQFLWWSWDMHL